MLQCKPNGFEPQLFPTAFVTSATTSLFSPHMFLPTSVFHQKLFLLMAFSTLTFSSRSLFWQTVEIIYFLRCHVPPEPRDLQRNWQFQINSPFLCRIRRLLHSWIISPSVNGFRRFSISTGTKCSLLFTFDFHLQRLLRFQSAP